MQKSTIKRVLYWKWLFKGGLIRIFPIKLNLFQLNNDLVSGLCEYRYVYHNEGIDDFNPKYGNWITITEEIKLKSDIVEVRCQKSSIIPISNYNYVWSHVIPRSASTKTGKEFANSEPEKQPSLIILGIDSMSLSNFIRQVSFFNTFYTNNSVA
jgi:hypothetical protein